MLVDGRFRSMPGRTAAEAAAAAAAAAAEAAIAMVTVTVIAVIVTSHGARAIKFNLAVDKEAFLQTQLCRLSELSCGKKNEKPMCLRG